MPLSTENLLCLSLPLPQGPVLPRSTPNRGKDRWQQWSEWSWCPLKPTSLTASVRLCSPVPQNRSVQATVAIFLVVEMAAKHLSFQQTGGGVLCLSSPGIWDGVGLYATAEDLGLTPLPPKPSGSLTCPLPPDRYLVDWLTWSEDPVMETGCKFIMLSWTWRPPQGPGSLPHDYWVKVNRFAASSMTAAS